MTIYEALALFGDFSTTQEKVRELDVHLQSHGFTIKEVDALAAELNFDKVHITRCPACTKYFRLGHWSRKYCGDACRKIGTKQRQAHEQESALLLLPDKACTYCGDFFPPIREWQEFCSTRCRVAAHRQGTRNASR